MNAAGNTIMSMGKNAAITNIWMLVKQNVAESITITRGMITNAADTFMNRLEMRIVDITMNRKVRTAAVINMKRTKMDVDAVIIMIKIMMNVYVTIIMMKVIMNVNAAITSIMENTGTVIIITSMMVMHAAVDTIMSMRNIMVMR